jgi:PAS domain S-box-containing protein
MRFLAETLGLRSTKAANHCLCPPRVLYTLCMQETSQPPLTPSIEIFRDVFDASPIGIAVENMEGQPLFVNRALCSILGFSEDELCGKHCVQFSPPEDAAKDWALFQQLRAGSIDHYQLDKRYFRRDGSLMWGRLSLSLLSIRPSPLVVAMVEDITEKKRGEETRFRHSAIVESSQDAIASLSLDGVITSWNRGAQRIFGYSESEVVGKSVNILHPPDLRNEGDKILEILKAGRRIDQFETVRSTKSGRRINVSLSVSPIKDSTGGIVGYSGIARDITEQKLAEDRLREYERAVEGSEEMIAVVDRDCRYLIANRKFLEMRNMTREQVVGRLAHEVLNAGVFETLVKEKLDQCFRGEVVRYELEYMYPDVGKRNILASYFPVENGKGIDRVACIFLDITDRKMAEASLRESEQRFRVVADTAPVMIWMSGTDKQPTYFNKAWLEFTGRALDVEQQYGLTDITHPDDLERCRKIYCEAFDSRRAFKKECRLRRHDGEYRWVLDNGVPRFLPDGSFVGYIGSCIDVTDHKLAEEALSHVNRRLIEAHEQECTRIAQELHDDINQRIALLAVQLETVKRDLPSSDIRVRRGINQALDCLSNLGSDIQALTHRLHSPKLEYLGLERASASFCSDLSVQHKVKIEFHSENIPKNLPQEISFCLFRVLQEALQNASKHSGSQHLEVVLTGKGENEIELTVHDSGVGFEPEEAIKGRGLGLANMKERLKLVDGHLSIHSKRDQGTTIHAYVPLSPRMNSTGTGV